jgi:outer membrane protein OmpA-like peptidoglycan-associated protein
MLAPLALGVLSRHARSQGLGSGALASMLSGQSGLLSGMLPGDLGKLLGIGTPGEDVPGPWRGAERAREVPSQLRTSEPLRAAGRQVQQRRVGVRAVVAAIAFALLAWALLRQRSEGERQARMPVPVKGPMESTPGMQREPPSQGIDALASYSGETLVGRRFSLSEITFEPGTSQLTPQSAQQVDRLAGVMKERAGMRVRLEGERADSVRDALAAGGIAAERVSTAGTRSGSGQPGATGATAQEAQAPVRVDVVVLEP